MAIDFVGLEPGYELEIGIEGVAKIAKDEFKLSLNADDAAKILQEAIKIYTLEKVRNPAVILRGKVKERIQKFKELKEGEAELAAAYTIAHELYKKIGLASSEGFYAFDEQNPGALVGDLLSEIDTGTTGKISQTARAVDSLKSLAEIFTRIIDKFGSPIVRGTVVYFLFKSKEKNPSNPREKIVKVLSGELKAVQRDGVLVIGVRNGRSERASIDKVFATERLAIVALMPNRGEVN